MAQVNSLLCLICQRKWPPYEEYEVCPNCREETFEAAHQPIDHDAAAFQAAHARFGWWLWDNERL